MHLYSCVTLIIKSGQTQSHRFDPLIHIHYNLSLLHIFLFDIVCYKKGIWILSISLSLPLAHTHTPELPVSCLYSFSTIQTAN